MWDTSLASTQCKHAPSIPAPTQWAGVTLIELLIVLVVMGIVLGYAALRIGNAADRAAVRAATAEAITTFDAARHAAIVRRAPVAVMIDTAAARVRLAANGATIMTRDLGREYGVRLAASRDSMAYDARGMGIGAANLSLEARRGSVADTILVSRLGRVRH